MKAQELITLNEQVKKMVTAYITKKNMTLYQFAKKTGIHQNQLFLYLNNTDEKKGLHSSSLKKIGVFLHENP